MKSVFRSIFLVLFAIANYIFGQSIPEKPDVIYPVYDQVALLSESVKDSINQKLIAFEKESSTEVLVVIIPSTNGEDINFYATQWGQKWAIGKAKIDNGVVFMIATKDRSISIQQGRAVESHLTASAAGEIIDYYVTPEFKSGNFDKGVQKGVDKIVDALKGKFKAQKHKAKPEKGNLIFTFLVFLIIFIIILKFSKNSGGNSGNGGTFFDDDVILSRNGRRGMWFPSGGSFRGESSSGNFGGFGGGGSFGGGGASGGW